MQSSNMGGQKSKNNASKLEGEQTIELVRDDVLNPKVEHHGRVGSGMLSGSLSHFSLPEALGVC